MREERGAPALATLVLIRPGITAKKQIECLEKVESLQFLFYHGFSE